MKERLIDNAELIRTLPKQSVKPESPCTCGDEPRGGCYWCKAEDYVVAEMGEEGLRRFRAQVFSWKRSAA